MGNGWLHTNLAWYDWAIMAVCVIGIRLISLSTRHFMRGVADFLAANRVAGRYLLTMAGWMGGQGAITFIASWQMHTNAGLPPLWWAFMTIPSGTIVTLTGWSYYRFRETRAMTLSQFLEMRYSKNFRIFTGILNWIAGIVNFGIFPAVTAHFFVYFCGLPDTFHPIPGLDYTMSTFAPIMALDLGLALLFVTQGGQISVMVTECAQGMFSSAAFIIIGIVVIMKLNWGDVTHALQTAEAGRSMINPYHTQKIGDYNIWYFLIGIFANFYTTLGWMGTQAYYCSARTPHEQKMGTILMSWRLIPQNLVVILLPIAAFTIMHLAKYQAGASEINSVLSGISNEAVRSQMQTPVAMAWFLPDGVKGLLATIMLFFSFTCHDTYMHSWGSIFVQDVYLPITDLIRARKKAAAAYLSPEKHIRLLRWSIAGVAIFGFLFSWIVPQSDDILMFFAITGTISLGGIGSAIVGGLYWRKGTTLGSYAAMWVGAIIGVGGIIISQVFKNYLHREFPINNQWMYMVAMLVAIGFYYFLSMMHYKKVTRTAATAGLAGGLASFFVLNPALNALNAGVPNGGAQVLPYPAAFAGIAAFFIGWFIWTLLSPKKPGVALFNLDRMLHRGEYAVEADRVIGAEKPPTFAEKLFGITEEFSVSDKIQAIFMVVWQMGWFAVFLGASIYNYAIHPISDEWFSKFWQFYIWQFIVASVPITIWFQIGGMRDIKDMYRLLATKERDASDDGRVHEPQECPEMTPALAGEPVAELDGGQASNK